MKTKAGALLLIGVFSFLILNTGAAQTKTDPTPAPSAEWWLSWSLEQRFLFVEAYLFGYGRGVTEACLAANNLFELDKLIYDLNEIVSARCFRHTKDYSKESDHYADVITEFYTKHVEYRNIPLTYMITLLIDGRYQTADELYQAAVKRKIQVDFTWISTEHPSLVKLVVQHNGQDQPLPKTITLATYSRREEIPVQDGRFEVPVEFLKAEKVTFAAEIAGETVRIKRLSVIPLTHESWTIVLADQSYGEDYKDSVIQGADIRASCILVLESLTVGQRTPIFVPDCRNRSKESR